MISKDTFAFLSSLAKNNNKEWFDANRTKYQQAQTEIKELLGYWIENLGKIEKDILLLEPAKCIFRINRDVRFSKDKSPYKTNLGAYISKGGKKSNFGGYYLHIEPNNCFFGAGIYAPMPEDLSKIRQEIDYNFNDFKAILSDKKFKATFENLDSENKLKKAPKGYDEDNEAIDFLKLKSFTVFAKIDDKTICSPNFPKELVELSKLSIPFITFLNQALE